MFWDNVAGVYDLFADIFNKETHKALIAAVSSRIAPDDAVLECAVIAANVIHLLDEPYKALAELDRVCRSGGMIIVPTYMNRSEQGRTSGFASTVGKAGADFKRQFTFDTYKQFIAAAGYDDVDYAYCPGRVPCAVAVIHKP